jgi:hypothetical protein
MMPFAVFALGLPEFYEFLIAGTAVVLVLPFVIGLVVSTYTKAIAATVLLALGWIPVAVIYGVSLNTQVGLVVALVLLAIVAHALRRLVRGVRARIRS